MANTIRLRQIAAEILAMANATADVTEARKLADVAHSLGALTGDRLTGRQQRDIMRGAMDRAQLAHGQAPGQG